MYTPVCMDAHVYMNPENSLAGGVWDLLSVLTLID